MEFDSQVGLVSMGPIIFVSFHCIDIARRLSWIFYYSKEAIFVGKVIVLHCPDSGVS